MLGKKGGLTIPGFNPLRFSSSYFLPTEWISSLGYQLSLSICKHSWEHAAHPSLYPVNAIMIQTVIRRKKIEKRHVLEKDYP